MSAVKKVKFFIYRLKNQLTNALKFYYNNGKGSKKYEK